jgi:hypothetical protein
LLTTTNAQRETNHLSDLELSSALNTAAQAKANDMVQKDYWAHVAPDGTQPWSFISATGYNYDHAGENLAYGFSDASAVTNAWMHSPEHRENLLSTQYTQVGFAVVPAANYQGHGPTTITVALYASPAIVPIDTQFAQSQPASAVKGASVETQSVSRLAALNRTNFSSLPLLVASVGGLSLLVFIGRHGRALHRSLVKSEAFVLEHPWLDVSLVALITVTILVSQTVGQIL